MKKSRTKDSEHLLINNAIKNLDNELYLKLRSTEFKLSENEIKTAILLKFGYTREEIGIYTAMNCDEIKSAIGSIIKKTKIKNINQLNKFRIKKKGGDPK